MKITEDELKLRKIIVDAGIRLKKEGLIARTWGNISARLNTNEFLITPSGMAYEDISFEDIVRLDIDNIEWDGKGRKPSSERGVHAAVYSLRPDVGFIIHTHQFYASAVCAEEEDVTLPDGTFVPCAVYALPGSIELSGNVRTLLSQNYKINSMLLAKHGVLCFAADYREAFSVAESLETGCRALYESRVTDNTAPKELLPYIDDYAQIIPADDHPDDPEAVRIITEKNIAAALYVRHASPISPEDAAFQHREYVSKYAHLRYSAVKAK